MEPAQNPLQTSPTKFGNRMNSLGRRNKAKWIKVGIFVLVLLFAVIGSWYSTQNQLKFGLPTLNFEKKLEVENKPTKEFYNQITTDDYNTLKKKAPNIVTQPNVIDPDIREQVDNVVKNNEPENHIVVVGEKGASNVYIKQGDIVTWNNQSGRSLTITGDGWQTYTPIANGEAFSQRFDFIGVYSYNINGDLQNTWTVEVAH